MNLAVSSRTLDRTTRLLAATIVFSIALLVLCATASTASALNLQLELVSRQSLLAGNAPADDYAVSRAMSANGRFVAFESWAPNLEGQGGFETYLRDTLTDRTELVSRGDGANGQLADAAYPGGVSDDGRYVTFVTLDYGNVLDPDSVIGFDPGLGPAQGNVYVRDTWLNQTKLISRASGAHGAGANGLSFGDSISANGRYVSFNSASSNLSSEATTMTPYGWPVIHTYVRDLYTNTTTLASRRSAVAGGAPADEGGSINNTSISNDGRRVAFSSYATNLDGAGSAGSFVRDLVSRTTRRVAGPDSINYWTGPKISGDGHVALFTEGEVYVRNLATNAVTLISRATGAGPNDPSDGYSMGSAISDSGRYVAFSSDSATLHPFGSSDHRQVYVRDVCAGTTTLVSRHAGNPMVPGDDDSDYPTISADGHSVGFNTWAPNLLDDDLDTPFMWRAVVARVDNP